jgi:hypothetical protein
MLLVPGSNQTREPNHGLRFANPTKVTALRVFFLYWSQEDASSADIVGSPPLRCEMAVAAQERLAEVGTPAAAAFAESVSVSRKERQGFSQDLRHSHFLVCNQLGVLTLFIQPSSG